MVFENINSGEHTIVVNDVYGNCDDRTLTFTVIKYPKFFTPNGDGFNDTWNIFDLKENSNVIISIFDRYYKSTPLAKQLYTTYWAPKQPRGGGSS